MKLVVTDAAVNWFREEVGLKEGDSVKFHGRYGGADPVQFGFSLMFTRNKPIRAVASVRKRGVLLFIEENDLWFFDGHDLHVDYDEKLEELSYTYVK